MKREMANLDYDLEPLENDSQEYTEDEELIAKMIDDYWGYLSPKTKDSIIEYSKILLDQFDVVI